MVLVGEKMWPGAFLLYNIIIFVGKKFIEDIKVSRC